MKRFTIAMAALAVAAVSAGTASAVTTVDGWASSGGANTPATLNTGSSINIDFSWTAAPASGYVQFTTTKAFDVFFTNYFPAVEGEVTGYVLKQAAAGGTTYTTGYDFCSSADTMAAIRGTCDLVAAYPDTTPYPDATEPTTDHTSLFRLDAGTYLLGFKEGGNPSIGQIGFQIAEVPLPAGGLLLLSGLGGIAALRRRRKA